MDVKKRKEYFILTTVCFVMGFLLFGMMAVGGKELLGIPFNAWLALLIYGFGGGLLIGGLMSGIMLFANFIRKRKLAFKIIACVVFPVTFMLICYVGILSFLPYAIYNFVAMRKLSKEEK